MSLMKVRCFPSSKRIRTMQVPPGTTEVITSTTAPIPHSSYAACCTRSPSRKKSLFSPSSNVVNLQRRTAGVLPIRVDVPKAGTSLQFVKPLVVDQEVVVKLRYKLR